MKKLIAIMCLLFSGFVMSANTNDRIIPVDYLVTGSAVVKLPTAHGTAGDVLSDDGSGLLSWLTVSATQPLVYDDGALSFVYQNTKAIYVDKNRSDTYTADGSPFLPYKTIAAATAVATTGTLIKIMPGSYAEDVILPAGVSIEGYAMNNASITGSLTTSGATPISIRYMQLGSSTKAVTIGCPASIIDSYSNGAVIVNSAVIQAYNFHIVPTAGVPLTLNGTAKYQGLMASISSTGNNSAIVVNGGTLILNTVQVSGSSATSTMLTSTAGQVVLLNSYVLNMGGGAAANIANGATTTPNMLNGVFAVGNFAAGSAYTVVEGMNITGTLSGTNLIYRSSDLLKNDSTVVGTTVSDALESLASDISELVFGATDITYSPTTEADWITVPTEVGGALDVLASDKVSRAGDDAIFGKLYTNDEKIRLGWVDGFSRGTILNAMPNATLLLGSLSSDGIPEGDVSSEGIVVYGKNLQDETMTGLDFGYARIKPNRFGIFTSNDGSGDYAWRVDGSSMYLKDDSFVKTFEVIRATGYISTTKVTSSAGVVLNTSATQPTCEAASRGMLWYVQGATGVADTLQVCMKDASDVYAWVTK